MYLKPQLYGSTLYHLSLLPQKVQKISHGYTQNETQKDHSQQIFWLLAAFWKQHFWR